MLISINWGGGGGEGLVPRGTFDEEGVLDVPGRMLLRLEQSVEIPEGTLDVIIGWHF